MLNLLIVDDESFVADMLEEMFAKELHGEVELFKAYSAKEALLVLEDVRIDIVLSDIKMPGISGLELLDRIKTQWPVCKVAFLTGFREFDYVYSAIRYDGVRYLLKTSDDDRILATIRELMGEIAKGHEMSGIVEKAQRQIQNALPLLQNEWIQNCMDGHFEFTVDLDVLMKELNIPLNAHKPTLMVIGKFDAKPSSWQRYDRNELRFALQAITERYLPEGLIHFASVMENETMIWCLQPGPTMEDKESTPSRKALTLLFGSLEYIQATTKATLGTTISFAVSGDYFVFLKMGEMFHKLRKTLYNRFGMGSEMILSSGEDTLTHKRTPSSEAVASLKSLGKFKLLEQYLDNSEEEQFRLECDGLLDPVRRVDARNDLPALEVYYRIATILLRYINEWELSERLSSTVDLSLLLRADAHSSWQVAIDYLQHIARLLFASQIERANRHADDVIAKLKTYINNHLHADLSLTKLAGLSHLNASYLSRLFKQETGNNLSDYIIDKRVGRAKELLRNSGKKIGEICMEVGYDSQQSFTRFFKNAEGMTPQEFREAF